MGQLGLHLRVNDAELAALAAHEGYASVMEYITEELEESKFGSGDVAETDKSWAYIHSALLGIDPDGPLSCEPQDASLAEPGMARFAIMGTEVLEASGDDYVGLTRKAQVGEVATELAAISLDDLSARVTRAHQRFGATGDAGEAAEYAASWFEGLVDFYRETAVRGDHVIFTVSF
ncbi:DUF1877 family protein [Erythrobacter oryzae]|uniref:DUF1877 family protein n=1 Tax=Erythrobacter oryzae TaxID=3019556 RepID=UPI0025533877|nr:DUF1877 family protein [Erythrobacter sp. COR-2]